MKIMVKMNAMAATFELMYLEGPVAKMKVWSQKGELLATGHNEAGIHGTRRDYVVDLLGLQDMSLDEAYKHLKFMSTIPVDGRRKL